MGANERQLAQRELEDLREKAAQRDRFWWRALWLVTVAAFGLLWYLLFPH
ncbi:MAG TPA: hypothetical protein VIK98_06315 [Limnochordales bacterium]